MSIVSYTRVTMEDGTTFDVPLHDYNDLLSAMQQYALTGREDVYEGYDLCGSRVAFFMSRLQDIYESTPEQRASARTLNKAVKDEAGFDN